MSSYLMVAFSRLELGDDIVRFCDDATNKAAEIQYNINRNVILCDITM